MSHSYIELKNRDIHWSDTKIGLVFSYILYVALEIDYKKCSELKSMLSESLLQPVSGMCDIDLNKIINDDHDRVHFSELLNESISQLSKFDKVIPKDFVNSIAINSPDSDFDNVNVSFMNDLLLELSIFINEQ